MPVDQFLIRLVSAVSIVYSLLILWYKPDALEKFEYVSVQYVHMFRKILCKVWTVLHYPLCPAPWLQLGQMACPVIPFSLFQTLK